MSDSELTLRGTARYAGDVAFGPVFQLTVAEDTGAVAAGETVLVTVLVGDERLAEVLHGHPTPDLVDADFALREEHDSAGSEHHSEYATASFSGFVDAAGRSWDLLDVRAADA
jgi:hypothetical protein